MNNETLRLVAKTHSTPAYVFDLDMLKERLCMMKKMLGEGVTLCYAMKANPFLIKAMDDLVDRFEVCSPGEFRICERNNIPMERIVLSGVNKEYDEITRVIDTYGAKGIFTVESYEQLRILDQCSRQRQQTITVLLRVTSGNQFGMDEETICRIIENRVLYPYLKWQGLQFYSGTQKKKLSKIKEELLHLDQFCCSLKKDYDFEVAELEYGPGFYVPYFQSEEEVDDEILLQEFSDILGSLSFCGHITLEMGRYIVAYCGYYLTSVVDQKFNNGQNYCIVDGGIHHINYFGQTMAMKHPHFTHLTDMQGESTKDWIICGSLCTVGDVLVKQLSLKNLQINDILVFKRVGAYAITEGIYLFLSRNLPRILFYSQENGMQLVRDSQPTDTINSII